MKPSGGAVKSVIVGTMNQEQKEGQKEQKCERCGMPVKLTYRVVRQEVDKRTGERRVTQGQYEVAHLDTVTRAVVSWECEIPGVLAEVTARAMERKRIEERHQVRTGSNVVHLWREETNGVECGAAGELQVNDGIEQVTCNNCIRRWHGQFGFSANRPVISQTNQTIANSGKKETETMSATAVDVKAKIAAAKAKAGGAKQGTVVALDGEGLPVPQATATKTKTVKAEKKEKAAKTLNLCGCGCGMAVKSNFVPGHDAKLHSWVKKVGRGDMKVEDLPEQVKVGMFKGVKQQSNKETIEKVVDGKTVKEVKVTLLGAEPSKTEAEYLQTLKGMGGDVQSA